MAHDIMSKFYSCTNMPLEDKLLELTKILDESSPNKDLQSMFLQLVNNIFAPSFNNSWNLKSVTYDCNRYEFDLLLKFLEPQGPMLRLCYKLLSDPQLKFELPIQQLPLDLQLSLERGRYPQFYADMLVIDSQMLNVVSLAMNAFDYYIFNFALYLVSGVQHQGSWENWNSVYFALACDYLIHFLPSDPNISVLPLIPTYTGKVPLVAPLQTANRPICSPTLLLIPDLGGMSNQHTSSPQSQSRNEVWRSETVLQVFIDVWMSVEEFSPKDNSMYQKKYSTVFSSPERVRTVRVLVKHVHAFSAKHLSDPASRSSALRKYARQLMCSRAYHYVKHLVMMWPLDASFRLVLELWLSLIQPWRYTNYDNNRNSFLRQNNNEQEDMNPISLDPSWALYIAENFPSYTCILQLVLPRFMRLDLTAYKNAIMLFRLGKVFSQPDLVPMLWNLEKSLSESPVFPKIPDSNYTSLDHSYVQEEVPLHKWVAIAKQAITEFNMSTNYEYDPVWGEHKATFASKFVQKIIAAKQAADNKLKEITKRVQDQNVGAWSSIKSWFMIGDDYEDNKLLEEYKRVPQYLSASITYFSNIFGLNEFTISTVEPETDISLESSSLTGGGAPTNFSQYITNKLRAKHTEIQYMGDPDLMPIASYESTILVRILYQIANKLNNMYQDEFSRLWNSNNFYGFVAREVLQKPCTVRNYVKNATNHQSLVSHELPARLSLRRLGSYATIIWFSVGYIIFRLISKSGLYYIFIIFVVWTLIVLTKAALKYFKLIRCT